MLVSVAEPEQREVVHQFLQVARPRHVYLADEDLDDRISRGDVLLAEDEGRLHGVLVVRSEGRLPSLPPPAPTRVYVDAVAVAAGASPSVILRELVAAWRSIPTGEDRILIAYGGPRWLDRALQAAGLALAERVEFFVLHRLSRRAEAFLSTRRPAALREASLGDLNALTLLDAATFDLLWHMTERDLYTLFMRGRLQLAEVDGVLAGYLAMTVDSSSVQLARLAVHPDWQGNGIGRQLLLDGLAAAAELGCRTALLNTQAGNLRSQQLYRSLGFRPTGERFPVYTLRQPSQT